MNTANVWFLSQKLWWCHNGVVQSLTAKFFTEAQNISRLERLRKLDDVLSLLKCWCWIWGNWRRSTWHVLEINSSSSRHSQPWRCAVMTRRRVEITWQRVIDSKTVVWLGNQPRRCHVTVTGRNVSWLITEKVGPAVIGWNFAVICYINFIMKLKTMDVFIDSVADSCWWMTSIGLICTMIIMMSTCFTPACGIYILWWNGITWESMRWLPMHRERWEPLCSILCSSSVYRAGNISTSVSSDTTTYNTKAINIHQQSQTQLDMWASVKEYASQWATFIFIMKNT